MSASATRNFQVTSEEGDVFVTFALALENSADLWLRLEKQFTCTPYQTFNYCRAWLESRTGEDILPCTLLVSDRLGGPLLFLPLGITNWHGRKLARFMGDSHTNFGMPLFRQDFRFSGATIEAIFTRLAEMAGIDAYLLDKMPMEWAGSANPLALLPHRAATDQAYFHILNEDVEATLKSMRSAGHLKQLRSKARKLGETGALEIGEVLRPGERAEALARFFAQKSQWCRDEGLKDVFGERDTQDFMRALLQEPGYLRLSTLRFNNNIHAVFLGLQNKNELCGWASSYLSDDLAAFSPGDLLLQHVISTACRNGIRHFDLGAGDAAYKTRWLHKDPPLVTAIFGVGAKGKSTARMLSGFYSAKALIKKSPLLTKWARMLGA